MAQLELLDAAVNVSSQEDLAALKLAISLFFAERAQQAIDKFVDCAITTNADYIVTEDNHFSHLKKLPFLTFKVQTLDEFMEEQI
jgi:predicted nucleic acid-binding protein